MAYATIAGLPLQVGLYTAIVSMVVYALLGTSRPLSVSTTTIAILTAAELGRAVPGGDPGALIAAGATLAVLTGAMLVAASVLRLGFVANFISEPVLTGFKSGIRLVIVVDQVPKLLGVLIEKAGFFRDLFVIARELPHASVATVAIAVCPLVLISTSSTLSLARRRRSSHSPRPLSRRACWA
jgi:sulfate permease, SulP family